jgi:hypothetical protein
MQVKNGGKENAPHFNEELRESMDNMTELNAYDEADVECTRRIRKEDYAHQEESGGESRLKHVLCETTDVDLREPRQITEVDLKKLIMSNDNLEDQQKERLIEVLLKYTEYLTTKPGKCKVYEYKFNVTDTIPTIGHSRPVPYSARASIRKQIEQMLEDGISELSDSSFINPLMIVYRENKDPRICIDARKVNNVMLPDRARAPPINEMLQQFHGVRYMTSLDLTSAFLQIPLEESSRKFTAFLFDTSVYQFQRVPFGTKNSLTAFVRGLRKVLGSDVRPFCACYVDDIVIFSKTFEEHLRHINLILSKLTTAGFTINALKCKFCQPQMKFVGHVIGKQAISADLQRIAAILSYPAPKNQKQLRQFLGTCGFHHKFVINYAALVAPFSAMLKKGVKWEWTDQLQKAFEELRSQFANSIHLVHPNVDFPYSVYTDASKFAIGALLMQTGENGETHIVSTASRVLTATEQRYSTCEQELLAIVYALSKFRIYVFGHKILVRTDSKALSFLQKCTLTSNRIARWVMQLQEYDIQISHISGSQNYLADIISRNPAGQTPQQIEQLTRPRDIMVAKIELNIDHQVKKDLKELAVYQDNDPCIKNLKERVVTQPVEVTGGRYAMLDGVMHCKNHKGYPFWRPILPSSLENKVIKFVHLSLGHAGSEKCIAEIAHTFYIKNLGQKVKKALSCCDICQRVKHPNRAYEVEIRSHLPTKPGDLCALDLYGQLPVGRGGVRYLLVCLDVFSKHTKLYPIRAATTKACLNKLTADYFPHVIIPSCILSDHGTQFTSPMWKKKLAQLDVSVKYSPIRHSESNPAERVMKEIGKYCKIYCHVTQKKWPELTPQIESWLNTTVSDSTGFTPVELMFNEKRPDLFAKILSKTKDQQPDTGSLQDKLTLAYLTMKQKAEKRKRRRKLGGTKWEPKLNEKVLLKCQPTSDAALGITAKFLRPFNGPWLIMKFIPPSCYEISDQRGKIRGVFNKTALKRYRRESEGK